MAEINVEKKNSFPWWIWIVVGLIVVGILFFLLGGDNQTGTNNTQDRERDRDRQDTVRRTPTTDIAPIVPLWENSRLLTEELQLIDPEFNHR